MKSISTLKVLSTFMLSERQLIESGVRGIPTGSRGKLLMRYFYYLFNLYLLYNLISLIARSHIYILITDPSPVPELLRINILNSRSVFPVRITSARRWERIWVPREQSIVIVFIEGAFNVAT